MKNLIRFGIILIAVIQFACEKEKSAPLISATGKVNFLSQKQILISLNTALNLTNAAKFEVTTGPGTGKAEIYLDKFMIYTPGSDSTENATVKFYDASGRTLGNGKITFEESQNSCGIIPFTKAEVAQGNTLNVHLADNTLLCANIEYVHIGVNGVSSGLNGNGFSLSTSLGDATPTVDLSYTPPAGFVGTSKILYVVGINVKPEYASQYAKINQAWLDNSGKPGSGDVITELITISYMFEYFIASIAEVTVK